MSKKTKLTKNTDYYINEYGNRVYDFDPSDVEDGPIKPDKIIEVIPDSMDWSDLNGGISLTLRWYTLEDRWYDHETIIGSDSELSEDENGDPLPVTTLVEESGILYRVPYKLPTQDLVKWIETIARASYDGTRTGLDFHEQEFVHPDVKHTTLKRANTNARESATANTVTSKAKQYIQSAVEGLNKALTAKNDAACAASLSYVNQMLLEAKSVLGNSINTRNYRKAVTVLQRTMNKIQNRQR